MQEIELIFKNIDKIVYKITIYITITLTGLWLLSSRAFWIFLYTLGIILCVWRIMETKNISGDYGFFLILGYLFLIGYFAKKIIKKILNKKKLYII